MAKTDATRELYNLVHSLSPTEKSYFKKSLSSRSDGKLEELFELFNKKKEYNKAYFQEKLTADHTNISEVCIRLTNRVLKTMALYQVANTPKAELNYLLMQIEYAYNKQQLSLCSRLVERGLKLSDSNDLFFFRYTLWEWKIRLIRNYHKAQTDYGKIYDELEHATNLQLKHVHLGRMGRYFETYSKVEKMTKKRHKEMLDIINGEEGNQESYARLNSAYLTQKARSIIAGMNFESGNWEKSLEVMEKHLKSMGPPEKLSERLFHMWTSSVGNILGLSALLLKRKLFLERRNEFAKAIQGKKTPLKDTWNWYLYIHDVSHEVSEGRFKIAKQKLFTLLNEIEAGKEKKLYTKELVQNSLNIVCFLSADYKEAIALCNDCLTSSEFLKYQNIAYTTRWVELLSIYMLNDTALFANKVLAMKRYLKKFNSGFDWEEPLLSTMQKTFDATDEVKKDSFKTLFKQLKPSNIELRSIFYDFDILLWIEAMSLGKSNSQLLTERYKAG